MQESNKNDKDVFEVIKSINVSITVPEDAGRSDKMFYQILQEGKSDKDIDKIYRFITAAENGGQIPSSAQLGKIINEAYVINPLRLFQIISSNNDLMYYWELLSMCNINILCTFATFDTQYTIFYYECARQIINKSSESECFQDGLVSAVVQIANDDQTLWERWIRKFEHNMNWSKLIFRVLEKAFQPALITYAQTISFDLTYKRELNKTLTEQLQKLSDEKIEYVLNGMADVICNRWKNLIIAKKSEDNAYYDDIFISSYINVIIYSLNHILAENDFWETELIKWINIFKTDMQKWFVSIIQMSKYYFLDLSYIYYLLIIKNVEYKKKLNSQVIKQLQQLRIYVNHYIYLNKNRNDKKVFNEFLILLDKFINE